MFENRTCCRYCEANLVLQFDVFRTALPPNCTNNLTTMWKCAEESPLLFYNLYSEAVFNAVFEDETVEVNNIRYSHVPVAYSEFADRLAARSIRVAAYLNQRLSSNRSRQIIHLECMCSFIFLARI